MNRSLFHPAGRARITKAAQISGATIGMFLFSVSLFSQANQARILGTVYDQSGSVVAGARITVIDVQKGVERSLTTDQAGAYAAPNLDPGMYRIRAEFKGFKTFERQNIQLEVGQEARVDITLQAGEQTQTVTVNEALPLLETTTATLSSIIGNEAINDLPLNGRSYVNLLSLRPGFINEPGGGQGNQAANGLRPGDNMFLVDGLNNYEWNTGQQLINGYATQGDAATLLPIDAIQEFSVEQNPKAEFGWEPGVQVNIGLKSGTNSLHGTAYAFGRDGSWDAANYFQSPTLPVPSLSVEQYGFTAGGPFKKDKVFWFVGFEAQQLSFGLTSPTTSPVDTSIGDPSASMVDACNALGPSNISALSARLAGLNPTTCVVSPATPSFENVFPANPGNQFPGTPKQILHFIGREYDLQWASEGRLSPQ